MNFPSELKSIKQWLVWRFEDNPTGKKPRKVPYYVSGNRRTGKQGSDDDRAALATYQAASDAVASGEYTGLGFALLPGDGLVGIDLDGITESAERAERAQRIIDACDSYTEHSPSGNGVHIFCRGTTETFKSNLLGIEVFSGSQFLTMTGQPYGDPRPMRDVPADTFQKLKRTVRKQSHDEPAPAPKPHAPTTGDKIHDALAYVSPDCGYDEWLRVGMALHSELGDSGLGVWDSWSARSAKYPGSREVSSHWRSFKGGAVTIASLFGLAKDAGWKPPARERPAPAPKRDPVTVTATPSAGHLTCDIHSPLPDSKDNGKPIATIENLAEICRRLSVTIRYNVIAKEDEIIIPGQSFSIDNAANASLAWLQSWCSRFGLPTDKLGGYVIYLADSNPHNPVAKWITSTPWDGRSRLADLCATIETDGDNTMRDTLMTRWLVSAVAAAFEPDGVSAHGVLVVQGPQYLGKTKWFKSLVPSDIGVVQDGMSLRPDDRDSVKQVCGFWLVELGELDATFRKSDIAALKSFLTRKRDVLRRAYAAKDSHYPRRTVFFGSVNPREFLSDPTGNRRYWTISATAINHDHGIDMQQLWAEVYENLYLKGASWYLTSDEMAALNGSNEEFTHIDPIDQRLQTRLDWDEPKTLWRWSTVTELLIEVGVDRPTKADLTQGGTYLAKVGCERRIIRGQSQVKVPNRSQGGT